MSRSAFGDFLSLCLQSFHYDGAEEIDLRILQPGAFTAFEEAFELSAGEGGAVDAARVGRDEGLHQRHLFLEGFFADVAAVEGVDAPFVFEQPVVTLADDTLGVLPLPAPGGLKEELEIERLQALRIAQMRLEEPYELLPGHQAVAPIEPGKSQMTHSPKPWHEACSFVLLLEIDEVPQLQNRMPCPVKTVITLHRPFGQDRNDEILVFGPLEAEDEPFHEMLRISNEERGMRNDV